MKLSMYEKTCISIGVFIFVFMFIWSCPDPQLISREKNEGPTITNTSNKSTMIICEDLFGNILWDSKLAEGETLPYGTMIIDLPTSSTKLIIKIQDGGTITTPHKKTL